MRHVLTFRSTSSFLVVAVLISVFPDGANGLQLREAERGRIRSLLRLPRSPALQQPPAATAPAAATTGATTAKAQAIHATEHGHTKVEEQRRPSPMPQKHYELVPLGAAIFFYGVTCCVVFATVMVMACCVYDAVARWCHLSRFHACQNKIQRVHEVFLMRKGEELLCPYCVEMISTSSRVVFLCGHRFHMDCANKWFREHPDKAGRCPMCEGAPPAAQRAPKAITCGSCQVPATGGTGDADCGHTCAAAGNGEKVGGEAPSDELLSFILGSLNRLYPDIIKKEYLARWAQCHTEIWMSELRCPRYQPLLHK